MSTKKISTKTAPKRNLTLTHDFSIGHVLRAWQMVSTEDAELQQSRAQDIQRWIMSAYGRLSQADIMATLLAAVLEMSTGLEPLYFGEITDAAAPFPKAKYVYHMVRSPNDESAYDADLAQKFEDKREAHGELYLRQTIPDFAPVTNQKRKTTVRNISTDFVDGKRVVVVTLRVKELVN